MGSPDIGYLRQNRRVSKVASTTLRDSFSVSLTVGAYGVAFGAAAVANGFSVLQSCLLSLLTFSGASQFAVVGVMGAGGNPISAIATASLLGVRNGLYGVITGFGVFIFWNLFTLAGALGAQAMGDIRAWGLDAAVPAAFLGLVWPRLVTKRDRMIAIAAVALALALTPILPAGLPIIATAFIAIAVGLRP